MCTVCVYIYIVVLNCFILYRILFHIIHGYQTRSQKGWRGQCRDPALRPWGPDFLSEQQQTLGRVSFTYCRKQLSQKMWTHERIIWASGRLHFEGCQMGKPVPNSKYRHMENRITASYGCSKYSPQHPSTPNWKPAGKLRVRGTTGCRATSLQMAQMNLRRSCQKISSGIHRFGSGHVQNITGMGLWKIMENHGKFWCLCPSAQSSPRKDRLIGSRVSISTYPTSTSHVETRKTETHRNA